jgi:dihydrodipicolinate synthase/N-acetylneuraminate lyase
VKGIAATLLPFDDQGAIAVEAFQNQLLRTHSAGLTNAVNMDTGYINYLSEQEQQLVLEWTREALPANTKFVAGAYVERLDGDLVTLYRRRSIR